MTTGRINQITILSPGLLFLGVLLAQPATKEKEPSHNCPARRDGVEFKMSPSFMTEQPLCSSVHPKVTRRGDHWRVHPRSAGFQFAASIFFPGGAIRNDVRENRHKARCSSTFQIGLLRSELPNRRPRIKALTEGCLLTDWLFCNDSHRASIQAFLSPTTDWRFNRATAALALWQSTDRAQRACGNFSPLAEPIAHGPICALSSLALGKMLSYWSSPGGAHWDLLH